MVLRRLLEFLSGEELQTSDCDRRSSGEEEEGRVRERKDVEGV